MLQGKTEDIISQDSQGQGPSQVYNQGTRWSEDFLWGQGQGMDALSDSFFFLHAFSTATSSSSATTVRGLEAPLRYGSPSVRASAMINLSLSLTLFFYLGGYQIIHFSDSSFYR